MPTAKKKSSLNVALGTELIEYINSQVGSGLYNNQSEVVRAALRQQQQGDKLDKTLDRLNEMIAEGMSAMRAGKVISAEDANAEVEALLAEAERAEQGAAAPTVGQPVRAKNRLSKPGLQHNKKTIR